MRTWSKIVGLIFLAVVSVYSGRATGAEPAKGATSVKPGGTEVRLLDDPFAVPATTQPAAEGKSVNAADVNVSPAGTVEIHVNEASLVEVLRMLSLQSQKNIVASNQVHGVITANLYDVTVREALDAILHANGFAYREKGNFIYVYTTKEIADMDKADRKVVTHVFPVHYTPAANAVNMIKPVLSPDAQVSFTTPATAGIDSGTGSVGGDSHATEDMIVVTDFPENIDRITALLKDIDRRPQQILIEATILRASLSEDNALGVDFTVLGGVDFSSLTAAGSNSGEALSGAIVDKAGGAGIVNKGYGAGQTGFTQGVPTGGLRVGLVTNNIAVFLQALETVSNTVVLANPKVLALNKQRGEVIVGRKDGYLTTTVSQTAAVQTVEFLDTGTRLVFRPFIGDDGFVRMEIHPEDSSGGLTANNPPLPFKITTEVTSNVLVKDGHTIVIGGLFRESSDSSRSQVPFLGNIPLAGNLFRQQRDRTTREEIIILLTPHIVKDEAAYSKASDAELREAERLRVGVRRGMMPFGRERLAESAYESAVTEMNKPNPDRNKALWHLNCATNLNPAFIEAITLKQNISGHEVMTSDSSTIRDFIRRQVLAERVAAAATMPAGDLAAAAPATQPIALAPATQPVAEAPTTQPVAQEAWQSGRMPEEDGPAFAAATTQPMAEPGVTITELPTDEVVEQPPTQEK